LRATYSQHPATLHLGPFAVLPISTIAVQHSLDGIASRIHGSDGADVGAKVGGVGDSVGGAVVGGRAAPHVTVTVANGGEAPVLMLSTVTVNGVVMALPPVVSLLYTCPAAILASRNVAAEPNPGGRRWIVTWF
jgi:hypothetical protein